MPDGTQQSLGGWNRISIEVDDLDSTVDKLKKLVAGSAMRLLQALGASRYFSKIPLGTL